MDSVLFHTVKKLRDVWVELGVDVCEDNEFECHMWLVEEIIEWREARKCRHNDRYVRSAVGTWRITRYTNSSTELMVLTGGLGWWDSVVVSWYRGEGHVFICWGCNSSLERNS